MKRISPKKVAAEFKRKKKLPAIGVFWGNLQGGEYEGNDSVDLHYNCACGLGILLPDSRLSYPALERVADRLGISHNYASGFASGFDGDSLGSCDETTLQGFSDGVDAHLETLRTLGFLDD